MGNHYFSKKAGWVCGERRITIGFRCGIKVRSGPLRAPSARVTNRIPGGFLLEDESGRSGR